MTPEAALQHIVERLKAMRAHARSKRDRYAREWLHLKRSQPDRPQLASDANVSTNRHCGEMDAFDRALKVVRKAIRDSHAGT